MGLKQVAIGIDQLGNTLAGGYADETISARCWRLRGTSRRWRMAWRVVDAIFGAGHCCGAYESERLRSQSPPEYRPAP
ncbi:hypothetical protein GCM10007933_02290 [Zoogloea oryzae]|uniref:Uncharacterized protein n=1 Tax=Zoogloea oryzae TaxID=310767 RepID=A0ABQ6F6A5_9RHOO|nr:hypothetical protein GCM10007933_02290 [Zoogloea oryzae]